MVTGGSQRRLAAAGTSNFRDVGGHPSADGRSARWRRLLRSDTVHRLDRAEAERIVAELRSALLERTAHAEEGNIRS